MIKNGFEWSNSAKISVKINIKFSFKMLKC